MVKLLVNGNEVKFTTTIFPDGTSQVWKLDDFEFDQYADEPVILWLYENEAELFHVLQLNALVEAEVGEPCILRAPYLPYGRQDKTIQNDMSFALRVFKDTLYNAGICRIETFDAHSKSEMVYDMPEVSVNDFHLELITRNRYKVLCFPDKGAAARYGSYGLDVIYCDKVRNQETGEITGFKLVDNGVDLTNKKVLIVDDICDGGATFIKVASLIKPFTFENIDLAVSHGLFSKGKQPLHLAGIDNIFTTNSLLRNPEGFKVW